MTILFITEFFPDLGRLNFSGGVETRTFFIAKNLSKKHEITVISRRKKGEKKKEADQRLKIIRLGREVESSEAKLSSISSRLYFIVQSFIIGLKFKPDLLEGSNFICYPSAWLIAKVKNVPVVAWCPDLLGKEWLRQFDFFTGIFGLILEKLSLLLSWTRVIALSQETKKKLIKRGIKDKKITVVYGGVDLGFIIKIETRKARQPTICCISRLVSYKNVDTLIKAVRLIKQDLKKIRCFIIGEGPEEARLKKLIRHLKLEKDIVFKKNLGYKQLIKILKSSHLFCLPSEIEGFGLATIEALAGGVPFVVADIPINKEVTKGKGGLFFKLNHHQDLASKAVKLLTNKDLAIKLVREGKELLRSYNWQKIASQTEGIYQSAIAGTM